MSLDTLLVTETIDVQESKQVGCEVGARTLPPSEGLEKAFRTAAHQCLRL